jgi:outer membrane receptor protein involved in Fe transport
VGNQVLYLVDGIPLNNGTYRDGPGPYLATIDPETVARVEIVRGPASALYGSDAQGGVVNMITRPHLVDLPGWSARGSAQMSGANRGTHGRVSLGYGSAALRAAAGASFHRAGDLRAGGGQGPQRPTGYEAGGFDGRLVWRPDNRHQVTVSAQHYTMRGVPRYDRYVTFRAPAPGADVEHVMSPQTRQLVYARHAWDARSRWLARLETTASYAIQREGRRTRALDDAGAPAPERVETRDDVFTPGLAIVGHSVPWVAGREVTLTWGGEAYRDRMATSGTIIDVASGLATDDRGRFPDGATMLRAGTFLSAEAALGRRLAVSGGARWSAFRTAADVGPAFGGAVENHTTALTGQLGVTARPLRAVTVAARLAGGFRAPNLYDLTNVGTVPGGIVVPNPAARPEQSISYELAVRRDGAATALDVTGWRMTIDDFLDRAPGTFQGDTLFRGERVFQAVNLAAATLVGVELELARRVGPVLLRTSAALTRGAQRLADGTEEPMAKIPPLAGGISAMWGGPGRPVTVTARLRWATRQDRLATRDLNDPRIPVGGTPGYAVMGLEVTWVAHPALVLSGGLDNLGDALYRAHASGVDGPGRFLWVGLTFTESRAGD